MKITRENVDAVVIKIMQSPSASYWLQNALKTSMSRDVVDALNDAEVLVSILKATYEKTLPFIDSKVHDGGAL